MIMGLYIGCAKTNACDVIINLSVLLLTVHDVPPFVDHIYNCADDCTPRKDSYLYIHGRERWVQLYLVFGLSSKLYGMMQDLMQDK